MQADSIWRGDIRQSILKAMKNFNMGTEGKMANKVLDPLIQCQLRRDGFDIDNKDRCEKLLKNGIPAWRSRLTKEKVQTKTRREIDIIVYKNGKLVGMIEVENDLDHLSHCRDNSKETRYDVLSIDRTPGGSYFYSYMSLERMATACRENIVSVPLFLAVGRIRKTARIDDEEVLRPRLEALQAELIFKECKR